MSSTYPYRLGGLALAAMVALASSPAAAQHERSATSHLEEGSGWYGIHRTRATSGLVLRGFSGRRLRLTLDGFRLDNDLVEAAYHPVLGLLDGRAIASGTVERPVETLGHGSGGVGGGLAFTSVVPHLEDDANRLSAAARFASAELEASGDLRMGLRRDDVTVFGGANVLRTSTLRPGLESLDEDEPGYSAFGGDAGMTFRLRHGELTLRYLAGRQADLDADPARDNASRRALDLVWAGYRSEPSGPGDTEADIRFGVVRQGRSGGDDDADSILIGAHGTVETAVGDAGSLQSGFSLNHEFAEGGVRTVGDAHIGLALADPLRLSVWGRAGAVATAIDGGGSRVDPVLAGGGSLGIALADDRLALGISVSTEQRHPSIAERSGNERLAGTSVVAREGLTPERFVSALLSGEWQDDPFRLRLGAFVSRGFDAISLRPTGFFDPSRFDAAGRPLPFVAASNAGGMRLFGLEGLFEANIGDLTLTVDTTWTRGDDARGPAPVVPALLGRAALRYGGQTWGVGPYIRFATTQDRVASGEDETLGHAIVGIRGHTALADWGYLALAVDNLADQGYRVHGSDVPEPGIDARVTLTVSFP